jgi:hypothetical protein
MYASSAATNPKTQFRTDNTYSTTFSGPIKKNERLFDTARNDAMAQAAYQGENRQWNKQAGTGVEAGGKMAAYRAGMMGDAAASKGYAQAQQETLNKMSDEPTANLQFQERLSGERGWVKDLLLDRDETLSRERMSGYKRMADVRLGEYERRIKEAIAAERRKTEILGGLL